jgi:hypothetical protein
VRNEVVLHRVREERNILWTVKRRKANWIGHVWRRDCLLIHVTEENIYTRMEVTRRQQRRRKKLLDDPKEREDTGN